MTSEPLQCKLRRSLSLHLDEEKLFPLSLPPSFQQPRGSVPPPPPCLGCCVADILVNSTTRQQPAYAQQGVSRGGFAGCKDEVFINTLQLSNTLKVTGRKRAGKSMGEHTPELSLQHVMDLQHTSPGDAVHTNITSSSGCS